MKRHLLLFLLVFCFHSYISAQSLSTGTKQEKRIALIIGNGNYISSVLANPENDARSMAEVLKKLGFKVFQYENLNQGQMKKAIDDFGMSIKGNDVSLFYYAGHGIQAKGYNYIIPVDAQLKTEEQVEYDCVRADRIMALMEKAGTKINIVILDACRNNPFERSWTRAATGRGLAFMNAPGGSLIAYATAPGSTASDGSGKNGLYTSAILESIQTPGLTIIQVFQQVRKIVAQKSANQQIPWESTSLTGDFYFNPVPDGDVKDLKSVNNKIPQGNIGNQGSLETRKSAGNEKPESFNADMRDFLISVFYMKIPAVSFTENSQVIARNIKSFEEFEKNPELIKRNGSIEGASNKKELTMYFTPSGIPVKSISYYLGEKDTTFVNYTLDSLTSLTSRSRTFSYLAQGRKVLNSATNRFVMKNDSAVEYFQKEITGEWKLADYLFHKTSISFMNRPDEDTKTVYVYNAEGHIIREVFGVKLTDKGLTGTYSGAVLYKYLEYDSAGNWTKRYMLNTNGALLLQTRFYNYY
ncbi:MAG: caspase family protein [Bacteroidales bacterium]